jgi:hypothetical protein
LSGFSFEYDQGREEGWFGKGNIHLVLCVSNHIKELESNRSGGFDRFFGWIHCALKIKERIHASAICKVKDRTRFQAAGGRGRTGDIWSGHPYIVGWDLVLYERQGEDGELLERS